MLLLSVILGLLSYIVRAVRWRLLFQPLGYTIPIFHSFIAVMVGYFANLLLPRMGEISRCVILKKTDKVDMASSFGTVIAERVIDMSCLFLTIIVGFIIEFDKLKTVIFPHVKGKVDHFNKYYWIIFIAVILILFVLFVSYLLFRKYKYVLHRYAVLRKIRSLVRELIEGFLAVKKIENPVLFWLATLSIWVLYFFMTRGPPRPGTHGRRPGGG